MKKNLPFSGKQVYDGPHVDRKKADGWVTLFGDRGKGALSIYKVTTRCMLLKKLQQVLFLTGTGIIAVKIKRMATTWLSKGSAMHAHYGKAILTLSSFLLAACHNLTETPLHLDDTSGDTDSSDTDSADTDSHAVQDSSTIDSCPEPIAEDCTESSIIMMSFEHPLPVLLTADQLEPGATFLALSGQGDILALSGEESEPRVILFQPNGPSALLPHFSLNNFSIATLPVSETDRVRAFMQNSHTSSAVSLLICLNDSCVLYKASSEIDAASTLIPVENSIVSCENDVQGLFTYGERICVFGRGVCCFDGTKWDILIESDPDSPLLHDQAVTMMDTNLDALLFVGGMGRVVHISSQGISDTWSEELPDFISIATTPKPYAETDTETYLAEDGRLFVNKGTTLNSCQRWNTPIRDADLLTHTCAGGDVHFGVTESGAFFRNTEQDNPLELCFTGQHFDNVVQTQVIRCGYDNPIVLTRTALYGIFECGITMMCE